MHLIDVPMLLEDRSTDMPSGPDLEYSPAYIEVARLMQGSPEVHYGNTFIAASEPDWQAVKKMTLDLLEQTHDLRLATWLVRALVALHGFAGLSDGLRLIQGLLECHWDHLHPQLDVEDGNDPTARINVLIALDDKEGLVGQVWSIRFVEALAQGQFDLRDIEIAGGARAALANEVAPEAETIDAAFMAMSFDELQSVEKLICESIDGMVRIDALIVERAGRESIIGLAVLQQVLRRAQIAVSSRLERHPDRVITPDRSGEGDAQMDVLDSGTPESRREVLRQLDRLCAYYASYEPASPVPLLLQRAKRLVEMNFLEILSDISPASIDEVAKIAGIKST